jgi:hypothetical protein
VLSSGDAGIEQVALERIAWCWVKWEITDGGVF